VLCIFATVFLVASSWYSFRAYSRHLGKIESAEAQTRSIIATVVDGIITMTDQGVILSVNPATEKMFGYKSANLVGQSITKIIPQRLFVHDMSNLGRGTMMAVGQRQNYFPFPIEMSLSEMTVAGRKNYVALIRDVTERKRSEETLRHIGMGVSAATGKEFVRSLVKQLSKALNSDFAFVVETIKKGDENVCSLIIAEQGNIRSKINYKLAGTPFDEVLKKGYRAYSDDVTDKYPNDEILHELAAKSFVAMPLIDHKGRAVGVMGVIDRKPMENIEIAESTLQIFAARAAAEIERQRYEDDLGAEKERLAVTLRSIGDGFITTDVEGRVLLLNNVAEKLTGWEDDAAIGKPLIDIFNICNERTRKPIRNAVDRIIETGSAVGLANHAIIVARDGTERLIETNASPIRDKMNKKIGVVLVFRDITEKSRAEEERRKAEKLESLGVAAGGIAHDFNNLLTGIIGNLSLALITVDPDDDMAERLNTAKKASIRAQDLAQQLLTFAKGGAPIKKTASIGQLIEDTVKFSLSGSNVQKEMSIPPSLWPVEIDAGQISQVLANLVQNAEQAMPAGGSVRVVCENFQLANEDANLSYLRPGRFVKITVQDEGIGIPAEYIKKIFDPYFTTKPKGSGLGLATAYSIIKSHDGMITVDSKAGAGSAFSIYLPASDKEVQSEKPSLAPKMGSGKILIMDDEEVICELVMHTLTPLGYSVTESRDASSCVKLYAEAMLAGKPFDAVIMDLTIPGGVGGKEAIKQLMEIDPSVKAIVSSGYATDPVMSRHREYGFCAMLAKPYEIADLAQIVHEVVGTKNETLVYHDFVQMQTA
jgi:PAS domain S-box-containing protein